MFSTAGMSLVSVCMVAMLGSGTETASPHIEVAASVSVEDAQVSSDAAKNQRPQLGPSSPIGQQVIASHREPQLITLSATGPDDMPVEYVITDLPSNGSLTDPLAVLTLTPADTPYVLRFQGQAVSYVSAEGHRGPDRFHFAIRRGTTTSPKATVSITVKTGNDPAYRTTVPALTKSRWTNREAEIPAAGIVNRNSYMACIQRIFNNQRPAAMKTAGRADAPGQHDHARREAFFYKATGKAIHARQAMAFLAGSNAYHTVGPHKDKAVGWETLVAAGQAYLWMKDCPALSDTDHAFVRGYLSMLDGKIPKNLEYGAMNRSLGYATGRAIVDLLHPDDPKHAERKAYAQQVWNDWWAQRDILENCTPYSAASWGFIATWIAATRQEYVYEDPAFRKVVERHLAQATPLGIMPEYGDAVGINSCPGRWIALFEQWAAAYRDGRYKWVAHRMFEWTVARETDMSQWGNNVISLMDHLMDAWLAADDSIPEKMPSIGSTVTSRKAMTWESPSKRKTTQYVGRLLDQDIPDKLVLRSGWEPGDLYALVETAPHMAHGHGDTGSINCMTAHGSLLLGAPPYLVKDHRFHNCFQLIPPGKPKFDGPALTTMKTTVPVFNDGRMATYSQVHIDGYMGQNASLDRRIFFVKNTLMWVQDTLTATQAMQAQVGPAWQTVTVYPIRGTNWANTCLITSPVSYIWELKYLMQWTNVPRDLLVVFLPDGRSTLRIDEVTHDNTMAVVPQPLQNNMKYRLWYQQDAALVAGTPVRFNSVLRPHAPREDCTSLAAMYSLVLDTPEATVVRVAVSPSRSLYLGINDSGNVLEFGGVRTDARRFLLDVDADAGVQYWIVEASILSVKESRLLQADTRRTVEHLD